MKAPLELVTGFPQGVRAAFSLRGADPSHGASEGPYGRLNLGAKVGDRPEAVAINRELFERSLGAEAFWLSQVHGSRVVAVDEARLGKQRHGAEPPEADASVTALGGVALTVLMADCMPVLAASQDGRAIGAAHAGWRSGSGRALAGWPLRCRRMFDRPFLPLRARPLFRADLATISPIYPSSHGIG